MQFAFPIIFYRDTILDFEIHRNIIFTYHSELYSGCSVLVFIPKSNFKITVFVLCPEYHSINTAMKLVPYFPNAKYTFFQDTHYTEYIGLLHNVVHVQKWHKSEISINEWNM